MNHVQIAVLGASGLIGAELTERLAIEGFDVTAVARRFTEAQKRNFGTAALECPVVALEDAALWQLLEKVDIVVNCIGVLQDSAGSSTEEVHAGFVERLLRTMARAAKPILLVQLSVPGDPEGDHTGFSRTKRDAERRIAASEVPHVILRPGFVVAPSAYGGSALVRALATLPFSLSARETGVPFAATAISDIARTISYVARRWQAGEREWAASWDVMEAAPSTIGDVVDAFRDRFGGPRARVELPFWLTSLGSWAGDLASLLGWRPPIRTTALMEMRRGVAGDPESWMSTTGIVPLSSAEALLQVPATVQEKWFARLYLVKGLILPTLSLFWIVSGLVALTVSFRAAAGILVSVGLPPGPAAAATVLTSIGDIAVGLAIAVRRTCRIGLLAGILVSSVYVLGAAILMPAIWFDPLGAMVKTLPAIVLMMVALAILDDR
jgi:uncharacterized protein YbjT (DUF2867 family)